MQRYSANVPASPKTISAIKLVIIIISTICYG
jgi:hypothetical protein